MRTYNEKISIYHGMASTLTLNTTANYIPIFSMAILGATNYQVGLISSIPPLITLLMTVPAAIMLNKAAEQKKLVAFSVLMARLVFMLLIFIAYIPQSIASWALLALIALMSIPNTMANMGWQALIGNMIEDRRRGQFFSDRNRLLTIVGLISTLTIGIIMRDATTNTLAYQLLFGLAFCFGLLEVYFLLKHEEGTPVQQKERKKAMNWAIFKDTNYVRFLLVALIFNFGWQMAWGLFNIYNVRYAEATIFWISMFSAANMLAQIFSFPLWRKWADKYGNMRVFVWIAFGMAVAPFAMALSTNFIYLTLMSVQSGLFVSGTVLILFNLLLENSPKENRTYCITSYNVLLAIIAFIAPQIGIWLLEAFTMSTAMNISTIVRLAGAFGFLYVWMTSRDRGALQ